jgi:integrase
MKILKFKKFEGLHIVCKSCNKTIEVNQAPYKGCNHPIEKQRYKAQFRINGIRKTKDLKSAEYDEAIKELLSFKEKLFNPLVIIPMEKPKTVEFDLFIDCIYMFSDWLENIGVPKHEQKKRSEKHIKETVGYLVKFKSFLQSKGYKVDSLTIYQIDNQAVGKYYEYLEKQTMSMATFNHNLRAIKSFFKFLLEEKQYNMPNPVKKAKLKCESPDPTCIQDNDFLMLLSVITEENSIETSKTGNRRNRYKSYIKDSIELAAYTGMRLEEVAVLKYSDIMLDQNGKLDYLAGQDLKYMRAHNWDNSKPKKVVPIPITHELMKLLNRLRYLDYIGSDRYLIDGDLTMSRASLAKEMSHAFTFFRRKAGLPEAYSIKHLRKTFLTKLEMQTGLAHAAGYQKTASVIHKNYIDRKQVSREIQKRGFSYFGEGQSQQPLAEKQSYGYGQ